MSSSTWLALLALVLAHYAVARPVLEYGTVNGSQAYCGCTSSHYKVDSLNQPLLSQNANAHSEQDQAATSQVAPVEVERRKMVLTPFDERYEALYGAEWFEPWKSWKRGQECLDDNYTDPPVALQSLNCIYGDELRKQGIGLTIDEELYQLRRGIDGHFDKILRTGDAKTKARIVRSNFEYYNKRYPWDYPGRRVPPKRASWFGVSP